MSRSHDERETDRTALARVAESVQMRLVYRGAMVVTPMLLGGLLWFAADCVHDLKQGLKEANMTMATLAVGFASKTAIYDTTFQNQHEQLVTHEERLNDQSLQLQRLEASRDTSHKWRIP